MYKITSHEDLIVWRKSVVLVSKVYAAARLLPSEEHDGLGQGLRLHIARGSLWEIETPDAVGSRSGIYHNLAPMAPYAQSLA